ncbi:hypothetical protein [Mesobacillus zeae]|uniref:hypothetical protein n=1 Tax=Mesobacillus zeae TaxID=1917180 RepID=UPI00300B31A8
MKTLDTILSFYVKRVFFSGENNSLIELISVTKEIVNFEGGQQLVQPEIMTSLMREISLSEAKIEGVDPFVNTEKKLFISADEAKQLCFASDDPQTFIERVNLLF